MGGKKQFEILATLLTMKPWVHLTLTCMEEPAMFLN